MKKNKISKNWINKQRRDVYVRKSKIEGYRSRAVYKLEEINQKFKIFHNGVSVLDLGAAPGSWTQYISKNYKNIKLASIDLKKFDEIENTQDYAINEFKDEPLLIVSKLKPQVGVQIEINGKMQIKVWLLH